MLAALVVVAVAVVVVPPLVAGRHVAQWQLVGTFASAMGTTAVATVTALSLRQSERSLGRLEADRLAEETRRLALLERGHVLEVARAFEVILAMRGHQARHPLQASLGEHGLSAESLDISSTQLALELARAYRELLTALYALPETRLPLLRGLDHDRPWEYSPETIAQVRVEVRAELARLTRLSAVGRADG